MADVISDLTKFTQTVLKQSGYGAKMWWAVSPDVFVSLVKLILATTNAADTLAARISDIGISIAGYTIVQVADVYYDYTAKKSVNAIPEKTIFGIALDAPHKLRYLSLDDVAANFVATPFYVRTIPKDNPSGYEIIGKSKPLPIPVPQAIVKATVL